MDTNNILMIFLILLLLIILLKINVTIVDTQTVPVHVPVPAPIKPIGGCAGTRYGCCPNGVTARMNPAGTNC